MALRTLGHARAFFVFAPALFRISADFFAEVEKRFSPQTLTFQIF